ncbi:MAG: RNA polymerase sigma factor [Deltaproteobacteria bacterium]|nr:RNA polymerase sigma factor [Deltaproteobacteria bacterium]
MAAPQTAVVLAQPPCREEDPDRVLVRRVIGGDEAAFQALYDLYFPRVYGFVQRRLRNQADTEETVQETFINLLSSIESYRGDAPFGAWVFGVTRRTVASRFKRKQHPMVPLGDDDSSEAHSANVARPPDPYEAYEFQERLEHMAEVAMCDLTQDQRDLFRLHHLQHHSIQHIAQMLNKSEDSVKSNLYRARKRLLAR